MALPASDNFNRADSGTLGSNWTKQSTDQLQIVSNQAAYTGVADSALVRWSADSFSADHYSQYTVSDNTKDHGPAVRIASGSNYTCYFIRGTDGQMFKIVSNAYTAIGTAKGAYSNGDVAKLEVTGTGGSMALQAYKNGSTHGGTVNDTALSSGSAGIWSWTESTNRMDDWSADDVGAAATGSRRVRRLMTLGVH